MQSVNHNTVIIHLVSSPNDWIGARGLAKLIGLGRRTGRKMDDDEWASGQMKRGSVRDAARLMTERLKGKASDGRGWKPPRLGPWDPLVLQFKIK